MAEEYFRVALVQTESCPDRTENLAGIRDALGRIGRGTDLVVFPENVLCLGNGASVRAAASEHNALREELGALVEAVGTPTVFGGVPLLEGGEVYNSSLAFDSEGVLLARYDKIHLFQLNPDSPDGIDESRIYAAGFHPVAFELRGWRIGLSICYDLRFPELYRALAPVDAFLCTAAFTAATGEAHWMPLLRARAIENQCHVIAVNQCGTNRETDIVNHGHSLVVDPWGKVTSEAERTPCILDVCLCRADIEKARGTIPALANRCDEGRFLDRVP
ncbi:MAG: carbon-nitrogen hydrolase family protein [Lentisphaeria bacterium]|nr:carbon-nitrogen hydrolase family protein [Lentisphaeria bacterium]